MTGEMFRLLRADEIDARIATCNAYGVSILLYKDARADMIILDETVGPMNWQRKHSRENANCVVSIWDTEKGQWIEKEDTGTESNMEKEKGLASDSFKRACTNWGIGRELYTSPQMFVRKDKLTSLENSGGRWTCKDHFTVTAIEYDGRRIRSVEIMNDRTREPMKFVNEPKPAAADKPIGKMKAKALEKLCADKGVPVEKVLERYGVEKLEDLTEQQHSFAVNALGKTNGNNGQS